MGAGSGGSKQTQEFDVVVVGGGINGTGIARDLVGRGYAVLLAEKDDLAQHTSSASTKLIHGGLRYLEYYEFNLVRKSLQEREVLLKSAPHIMWPLRFVMPHDAHFRPTWMIRIGLFLYDHLARREFLPGSEGVDLRKHVAGEPIQPRFRKGFVYSDAWVQDARLVTLCAMDARKRGAEILTRTTVVAATRDAQAWTVTLRDEHGHPRQVKARALVNAAGPWVGEFLKLSGVAGNRSVRLVKGSHMVVKRMFNHPYAYIFQNPDKRIIFAIPYEDEFTLIGTTDVEYNADPAKVAIDNNEVAYLCDMASRYFKAPVTPADVVWSYSGIRPLLDDESANASSVTRDYELVLDNGAAPLLSVFGGKITTFRKLSEEAADKLQTMLGHRPGQRGTWTEAAKLPGGDVPSLDIMVYAAKLRADHPWLPEALARRYARSYGSLTATLLNGARTLADLGTEVAPGVFEAELCYAVREEFVRQADDFLWRRTKLGLHLPAESATAISVWLQENVAKLTESKNID